MEVEQSAAQTYSSVKTQTVVFGKSTVGLAGMCFFNLSGSSWVEPESWSSLFSLRSFPGFSFGSGRRPRPLQRCWFWLETRQDHVHSFNNGHFAASWPSFSQQVCVCECVCDFTASFQLLRCLSSVVFSCSWKCFTTKTGFCFYSNLSVPNKCSVAGINCNLSNSSRCFKSKVL